ncbi:MAG: glycosyltransferase family 4 protein, partial [Candidatus Pacebacteria bacterium]|nr:glycosyltransferase family 4 protein [Candidatus Paceibacterota bacterium]
SLQKRGGGALDALGLSRGLCENRFGHEVVISEGNELAGEFTENEYRRVAKIATYGSSGGSFLLNSLLLVRPFRLIAVVRKYRPSVVHITHFHPWAFLIFLSRPFFGYKIVYGIHEDPYSRKDAGNPAVMGPLERMFARWADMVAAYSDYMKSVLERHIPGSRIVMIRPGDYRSFYPNFAHKGFHANGTLKLLFFGPIKEYKGVDVLVRAMAICKERGIDAALTIAGVQGPSKKIINEDEVRSLGIVWIDRFLRREEVGALMEEADVMMIPYKEATQTTPGLLAVAYGLPAIGTKSGGLPEEVRDGVNGLLVDPGDAKGLADVIGRICGNRSLLDEFGKGAKMLYGSEFSSRSIAEKAIREAYEPFFRQ